MKFQADKKHVSVTGRTIYREGMLSVIADALPVLKF